MITTLIILSIAIAGLIWAFDQLSFYKRYGKKTGKDPYENRMQIPVGDRCISVSFTEFDDLFYSKFPELRDLEEWFVSPDSSDQWAKIINDKGGILVRDRCDYEHSTKRSIKRNGRVVYKVGDIINAVKDLNKRELRYSAAADSDNEMIDISDDNLICRLKLSRITNINNEDLLYFEVVN